MKTKRWKLVKPKGVKRDTSSRRTGLGRSFRAGLSTATAVDPSPLILRARAIDEAFEQAMQNEIHSQESAPTSSVNAVEEACDRAIREMQRDLERDLLRSLAATIPQDDE